MGQLTLLLIIGVFGTVASQSTYYGNSNDLQSQLSPAYGRRAGSRSQNSYWPFQNTQYSSTQFNLAQSQPQPIVQTLNPTSQELLLQRRQNELNQAYPIVLAQDRAAYAEALRQQPGFGNSAYAEALRQQPGFGSSAYAEQLRQQYGYGSSAYPQSQSDYNFFQYRPTQLDYKRPIPPSPQRPVITLGQQPKLAYGEPYLRVPYNDNRRPGPINPSAIPPLAIPQNREFGPFGNRGPYRNRYPLPTYADTQSQPFVPEYGPFGATGPYAPKYTGYIPILRFKQDMNPGTGEYDFEYQTGNGIYRKETGGLKRIPVYNPKTRQYEEGVGSVKAGVVSWTSPEGIPFSFSFIADENGYRPTPLVQAPAPEALALTKTAGYQTALPYQ